MKIREVISAADKKEFLQLPVRLYKDEPNWIQPLDKDINAVFDPSKNKAFRTGKITRWLLLNDQHEAIGRIAAFYDQKFSKKGNDQPTGGIGYFECIQDQSAAFLLFDQCKKWLIENGMEAMDGPVNFGSREKWWGLLIEGFNIQPNYQCNYNFPYYHNFFEAYGFQVYFYQLTFGRKVKGAIGDKLLMKNELIKKDPNYRFDYLRKKDWKNLPELIRTVYNKAWANRSEIPELTSLQAVNLVKQMKPIMDEKLLWFGYYGNEPIAFFLSLPEVNQIFKYLHGKMDLFGKLKFLWYSWRKINKKAFGVLFGITPEHQGKGVDGAIIEAFRVLLQGEYSRYEDYEMNWIGDFNTKMIKMCEQINVTVTKRHATYRILFDSSKPFKRYPIKG
jgi:hypothetical protein